MTVTWSQSCQPAGAPLYACQCWAVRKADLSWHRGLPGWVKGSDTRSALGKSVHALPWQLPASHTAAASPWLPPNLDRTPVTSYRERHKVIQVISILEIQEKIHNVPPVPAATSPAN